MISSTFSFLCLLNLQNDNKLLNLKNLSKRIVVLVCALDKFIRKVRYDAMRCDDFTFDSIILTKNLFV